MMPAQMKALSSESGFTGKELIVVMIIIIALCILAIPQYFSLREKSRQKKMNNTIASVQAGIAAWHYRKLVDNIDAFPEKLDSNDFNSKCTKCFEEILDKPVKNELWFKAGQTEYYFSLKGKTGSPKAYKEKGNFKVIYNPTQGTITAQIIE